MLRFILRSIIIYEILINGNFYYYYYNRKNTNNEPKHFMKNITLAIKLRFVQNSNNII